VASSLDAAKSIFTKKFKDKTKNDWEDRAEFEKYNGKYDMVKMDYSAGSNQEDEVDSKPSIKSEPDVKTEVPESTLETQVQDLIKLICDISTMEQSVVEMEYDTKKAPLGKITTEQIKAGYEALKRISDCIDKGKTSGGEITQACNDFYTRIPHEFGFRVPPMIRSHVDVKKKIGLLEALSDIQVALKMLSGLTDDTINPVDAKYNQLKVDIKHLEKDNAERKIIEESIHITRGPTHSNYSMEVMEVFKLHKQQEQETFLDVGNKKLLFHGSRLSNWAGILGQGLRIAPPEAPVTGYMFGKGVYFADCSSKSANYCFTNRSHNTGLLMICEVSLGKQNKLLNADYNAAKMPPGCHSVLGAGKMEPSTEAQIGDTLMPTGKLKDTGVKGDGFILQYNEFIVYKTAQIKMKYLAKIKFNFKY
jgi:poly [ADP-ribose] polymerase